MNQDLTEAVQQLLQSTAQELEQLKAQDFTVYENQLDLTNRVANNIISIALESSSALGNKQESQIAIISGIALALGWLCKTAGLPQPEAINLIQSAYKMAELAGQEGTK